MNLGGKEQVMKLAELYGETPGLINKIKYVEKTLGAKTSDALVEVFLNNILFGLMTHIKMLVVIGYLKLLEELKEKLLLECMAAEQ